LRDTRPRNAGPPLDVVEREGRDRLAERLDALHVRGDERPVVQTLRQDDAHHAGEQRRVLPRFHLEMDVGDAGELGAARIDGDDVRPALAGLAQMAEAVGVGRPALARERRDAGIVADEQQDVRVDEALHAGIPRAVPRPAGGNGGLVDGVGGEVPRRADRPHPGDGERLAATEETVGARVERDGGRAVPRDDGRQTGGHRVHGCLAGDGAEVAVGQALAAATEAVGMVVLLDQGPALRAQVAARDDVVAVATNRDRTAVLDFHLDAADRVAESAEGFVGLHHARRYVRRGDSARTGYGYPRAAAEVNAPNGGGGGPGAGWKSAWGCRKQGSCGPGRWTPTTFRSPTT